jgi:hypothetical protein
MRLTSATACRESAWIGRIFGGRWRRVAKAANADSQFRVFVFPLSSIRAFPRNPRLSAESPCGIQPASGIPPRGTEELNAETAETRENARTGGGVLPAQQKRRGEPWFCFSPFAPIRAFPRVIRQFPRKALPESGSQAGSRYAAPNSGTRMTRKLRIFADRWRREAGTTKADRESWFVFVLRLAVSAFIRASRKNPG